MVFHLEDISSIRLSCKKCGNEAGWEQTGTRKELPGNCNFCGEKWLTPQSHLWKLADALTGLIRVNGQADNSQESFRLRFEIRTNQDG